MRFPEFIGEWKVERLGDIIEFKAGYAFPSSGMLNAKSTYQLIKMSNVYRNELRLDRNPSFWDRVNVKQTEFLLKKGDTILTLTGTVGKKDFGYSVQINEDDKYLLNQRLVLLREKKGKSVNGFVGQVVSNEKFLDDFFEIAKGGTGNQTNVGIEGIKNLSFHFPFEPEQRKIAEFLDLIDRRIQTQNKIIGELKLLKSSVVKKFFENKLRFKNRDSNSNWERKKLGEISKEHLHKNRNNQYLEVFSVSKHKGVINQIEHLGRSFSAKEIMHYKLVYNGDLVYTKSPTSEFPFGIIKQNRTGRVGVVSPLYCVFTPKTFALGYLLHEYFNSPVNTFNYLNPLVQKGAKNTMNINNDTFLNGAKLLLPTNEKEQDKIYNILSLINNKIEVENLLLTQYENQKKYLLQNLFI